jgi:hypothetical protein
MDKGNVAFAFFTCFGHTLIMGEEYVFIALCTSLEGSLKTFESFQVAAEEKQF